MISADSYTNHLKAIAAFNRQIRQKCIGAKPRIAVLMKPVLDYDSSRNGGNVHAQETTGLIDCRLV